MGTKLKDIYNQVLNEEIYGRNAIVYHRTRVVDLINKIYTNGFKSNKGMYGNGFYATYELEPQLNNSMSYQYGNVICKFQVTIDKFLILDYAEFIKSPLGRQLEYNKNNFIPKQLDYFNLSYDRQELYRIIQLPSEYTSTIAEWCYLNIVDIIKKIDGMIFTGQQDGPVLVCYKPNNLIIPISYKTDEETEWVKADKNLTYLKRIFNDREKIATNKNFDKDLNAYGIDKLINCTIEQLENDFSWLLKADILHAVIEVQNNNIIWHSGDFKRGKWKGGIWKNGLFSNSKWKNGIFENGVISNNSTFEDGEFINGKFLSSVWYYGIFKGGEFKLSTWEDGIFENGEFTKKSTWKGGVFKGGDFSDSIWEDGTFENGNFIGRAWLGGKWKGGKWNKNLGIHPNKLNK